MFPANHKTIFVIDHTPYFGISCDAPIEFDFMKTRNSPFATPTKICKTLWTCSVESALEYSRIVWDLFPTGKLIQFICSDTMAHSMNTWLANQQTLSCISAGLNILGLPPPQRLAGNPEHTVIHGLRLAIAALADITSMQLRHISKKTEGEQLVNRGRVICITSARDDSSMKRLEEIFHNVLHQENQLIASTMANAERCLSIEHCHLVILNTFPVTCESQVSNHPARDYSAFLTTEVHSIPAPQISNKLSTLILEHFDLASTTVTGIPMKEEQNASSSANYDVEIYHVSAAHTSILKSHAIDAAANRTIKEGLDYETVTLKWCTPRSGSSSEMQNCTAMHRITPVDVNSRPSLCLINFLLNGRSVMLEMTRKAGGKITSHVLAAHGGEIFVHALATSRSVLEDPPSISEGGGGRVTDYRITDFGALIKQNRLYSLRPGSGVYSDRPTLRMKQRLARQTKYFPLTISSTLVYNLKPYLDPLPAIITQAKITDDDVNKCKGVIFNLVGMETKHEALHLTSVGNKFKGLKREDVYKCMWRELEMLLRNNQHSDNHKAVYHCLVDCHKFSDVGSEFFGTDGRQRASVIRATTDSPMSPPLVTSPYPQQQQQQQQQQRPPGRRSLFDIYMSSISAKKTRPDFFGRSDGSLFAKLYMKRETERTTPAKTEAAE